MSSPSVKLQQGQQEADQALTGAGWHEGEEPKVGGSVTFRFCRNEDSEATGSDITVSYVNHVRGDETTKAYLGEVAIWR